MGVETITAEGKMSKQEKKLEKDGEMEIIRGSKILSLIEITEEDKKLLQKNR